MSAVFVFKDRVGKWAVSALMSVACISAFAQTATPGRYVIDSERSSIYWRVYKAGAFAQFGHNHVISVPMPAGWVDVASPITDSRAELEFTVEDFVVDDPQLRSAYGEDFASEPTAEDIEGTRRNMLSETVLDGANFPVLGVVGTELSGRDGTQTLALEISMLGRVQSVVVPVEVSISEGEVVAEGEFRLTHADLGLEPFSVLMGALQVADEMDFSFEIRASRQD